MPATGATPIRTMGVRRAWARRRPQTRLARACEAIVAVAAGALAGCAASVNDPFDIMGPRDTVDSGGATNTVDSAPTAPATDAASLIVAPTREAGSGYLTATDGVDASTASPCSNAASAYVYVLSDENDIYRFAPDQMTFTKITAISCHTSATPNSMAVDRNATAWVNYLDGTLQPVSTVDGTCKGAPITLPPAWTQVGMAYVAGNPSMPEALYVAGSYASAGAGLASVDTTTGVLTPIGQYNASLTLTSAELTGTGDGRLFGFFVQSPPLLGGINPANASILSQTTLSTVTLTSASSFAFSFWGGRFYFYTYPNTNSTSTDVAEYDPTTGTLDPSYMTDIGFVIVGAGVSTCAPVVPPIPK